MDTLCAPGRPTAVVTLNVRVVESEAHRAVRVLVFCVNEYSATSLMAKVEVEEAEEAEEESEGSCPVSAPRAAEMEEETEERRSAPRVD